MKTLLLVVAAVLCAAPAVSAQNNAAANVTAQVIKSLSIVKDQDLVYGKIPQGSSLIVAKDDAEAGKFTIAGEANESVSITYTQITTLSDGSNTLAYTQVVAAGTADDGAAASNLAAGAGTVTLDGTNGNAYVYLAGTINAGPAQVVGDYTETVTVTVAYP